MNQKTSKTPKMKTGCPVVILLNRQVQPVQFIGFPPTVGSLVEPAIERLAVVSAMGDALIPSAPGDPGYKDLEAHGISQEVLKGDTRSQ